MRVSSEDRGVDWRMETMLPIALRYCSLSVRRMPYTRTILVFCRTKKIQHVYLKLRKVFDYYGSLIVCYVVRLNGEILDQPGIMRGMGYWSKMEISLKTVCSNYVCTVSHVRYIQA